MNSQIISWDPYIIYDTMDNILVNLYQLSEMSNSPARTRQFNSIAIIINEFKGAIYIREIVLPPNNSIAWEQNGLSTNTALSLRAILLSLNNHIEIMLNNTKEIVYEDIDYKMDAFQAALMFIREELEFNYRLLTDKSIDGIDIILNGMYNLEKYKVMERYSYYPHNMGNNMMKKFIFNQCDDVIYYINVLLSFPNLGNKRFISPRRLRFLFSWFADSLDDNDQFMKIGERIKNYVVDVPGFGGMINEHTAYTLLSKIESEKNETYFIIAIDLNKINRLVMYTTNGKRWISGRELQTLYSQYHIIKPYPYTIFDLDSIFDFEDNVKVFFNKHV